MTCHRCPHNREIARLREICSKCELGDACAVSGTFSLDAMTDGAIDDPRMRAQRAAGLQANATFNPDEIDQPAAPETPEQRAHDAFVSLLADLSQVPYESLYDLISLVRQFDGLDKREFTLVQHFLNGGTMASYARAENLSKQTAFARCKALFRHKPLFKAIANGLLGKLKGGRKAQPKAVQPTLFDFASGDQPKPFQHETVSSTGAREGE